MAKFLWRVAAGYGWSAAAEDDEPLLVPVGDWQAREYAPLEEFSGLFRTFAATPATRVGVLEFANKFGPLGFGTSGAGGDLEDDWEVRGNKEWQEDDQARREPNWEGYSAWVQHIVWLRECVATWDRAQSDNVSEPAVRRMEETVLNQLRGRVRVSFARDKRVGGFVLQILPINLLGAIWLQLAETISGSKKHRACEACGEWFEVSPQKYRKSKHYCGEHCRSRAYRSRKEQARKMSVEGKTIAEIKAALGSDTKTIKGWLKERG
jgi:hypothetical protein